MEKLFVKKNVLWIYDKYTRRYLILDFDIGDMRKVAFK